MPSMSNLVGCVWELLSEESLLVTYCDEATTLDQWRRYTKAMREFKGRGSTRFLIYAGVVPPREVLADIASVARGETWTVALISPLISVRFAASTFAFVVKGFRFFAPDRVADALAHLSCDEAEKQRAFQSLARMRGREISVSPPQ
jgi:hypothetical protein